MKRWYLWILFSSLLVISLTLLDLFGTWQVSKSAADFGIEEYHSSQDKNNNGIDDTHDFVLGARDYIQTNPRYGSRYYAGGTPNDGYGVCTDVISYAFAAAGYSLKDMVDDDIIRNQELYGIDIPDANIDYRRVDNLQIFFNVMQQNCRPFVKIPKNGSQEILSFIDSISGFAVTAVIHKVILC